jgi:hypothetical protein
LSKDELLLEKQQERIILLVDKQQTQIRELGSRQARALQARSLRVMSLLALAGAPPIRKLIKGLKHQRQREFTKERAASVVTIQLALVAGTVVKQVTLEVGLSAAA